MIISELFVTDSEFSIRPIFVKIQKQIPPQKAMVRVDRQKRNVPDRNLKCELRQNDETTYKHTQTALILSLSLSLNTHKKAL